ncbi:MULTISPECIES: hypothetical protein [unclassified Marinovum]|uniref:hypothetical protein n=1 Tax=unclassified Marinovum TaxID=2647166 RepID=UPI003EDBB657
MALVKILPATTVVEKSGITIAVSDGKAGQAIRLGVSELAQQKYFGRALDPAKDALELLLDDERGKVHVLGLRRCDRAAPAALTLRGGIRGSVSVSVMPWRQIAAGKRPSVAMPVLSTGEMMVSVKLPEWARPEVRKIGQGQSIMD